MIKLLRSIRNIFAIPDLRDKIGFTLLVLAVYRLGVHIPLPGINTHVLSSLAGNHAANGFLAYLDLFSGGALRQFAIFALGIVPYISASIMMQILTITLPELERLSKEGNYGRQVINQYTRYLGFGLSLFQGFGIAMFIERSFQGLAIAPGWAFRFSTMLVLSIGFLFVMWLSEQINAHGIGNGSSMIIFAGIVANLPSAIIKVLSAVQIGETDPLLAGGLVAFLLAVISIVVFLEKGERRVPISYARRVVGNRVYGGQSSYIPFKMNPANVVPVIFAGSFLATITMFVRIGLFQQFYLFEVLGRMLEPRAPFHMFLTATLIIMFTYFYTALIFNPTELAENIKKSGGFIPGVRPGRKTADFFEYLLNRVCLPGSLYLATLAIAPRIIGMYIPFPVMFEGTSMLIVVGVAIDLSAQIESYLIERRYEGFLPSGKLKARVGRGR